VNVRTKPVRELTLELDRDNLAALGSVTVRDYARLQGVGEAAAKNRLRRLYESGGCDRHTVPSLTGAGRQPWVYTAKEAG